jgi:hypothetical protein
MSKDDFFKKYGLTVQPGEVQIGRVYPLYGAITEILDERLETFTIEINHGLILRCSIQDQDSIEKIKKRAFEPAIFVTEITSVEPVEGECTTIVFGKSLTSGIT